MTEHSRSQKQHLIVAWKASTLLPVLLSGFFVLVGTEAKAQTENLPFADCKLSQTTIDSLMKDLGAASSRIVPSGISFVVLYQLEAENWGQPMEGGGTTASVLCAAPDLNVMPVAEDTPFPPNGTVDILNAGDAFAVRVRAENGMFATRICFTSKTPDANPVTCFGIVPP
jgi:hypothetical protein